MRRIVVAAGVAALLAGSAVSASAITGNFEKDFTNDGVGLVVFYADPEGEVFAGRCSGTLLTPTVFLTAGHCTDGAEAARVYFEQDAGANLDPVTGIDAVTGYPFEGGVEAASIHTMDGYDDYATFPDTSDAGIVVLDDAVENVRFGALPTVGSLDELARPSQKQDVWFTVSGYGLSYVNPAQQISFRERLKARATLTNLRSNLACGANFAHSGNPGGGKGGTCFGDSGGPVFHRDTDVIAGLTSFGLSQQTCTGPGFAYRTDQERVHDFVLAVATAVGEADLVRIAAP
jgi:hypothetical protein